MPRFCNVEITNMSEKYQSQWDYREDRRRYGLCQESSNNRLAPDDHAKSMCTASESKEKIIEVPDNSGKFHINEEVQLCGQSSLGLQAVLLAFVFPLIIVFAAIVTGTSMQWEETTSGLTGLLLLVPYYCILYFLRDKTEKAIHIYFEKT